MDGRGAGAWDAGRFRVQTGSHHSGLNIPRIPGIAILAQFKPAAPVVVFSSSSNPVEIQRAKELGVREFVQKPIDFEEFERVVKRMIQNWAKPSVNSSACG